MWIILDKHLLNFYTFRRNQWPEYGQKDRDKQTKPLFSWETNVSPTDIYICSVPNKWLECQHTVAGSVAVHACTVSVLGSCVAVGGAAAAVGVAAGAAGGVASCRSAAKEREKRALMVAVWQWMWHAAMI